MQREPFTPCLLPGAKPVPYLYPQSVPRTCAEPCHGVFRPGRASFDKVEAQLAKAIADY